MTGAGGTGAGGTGASSAGRTVDYLRLSVTDRCNFRCSYCMPPEGVEFKSHEEILTYEDMIFFVRVAAQVGISKIRLTGGEPLVRKDLSDLVKQLSAIEGVTDISLTTNGVLLPRFAGALRDAGLRRVNISIDSLDPERFRALTRGGSLADALAGVDAAFEQGLLPVKVNAVMLPELLEEVHAFAEFTRARPVHVRFIEWMPVGGCGPSDSVSTLSKDRLMEAFAAIESMDPVTSPGGWGPARYFRLPGHEGTVGFISSMSDHFCGDCNRLRLTADGRLKSCLFSGDEVEVIKLLRQRDEAGTLEAVRRSLDGKTFDKNRVREMNSRGMSQIGG
ncbi:MAG: GTP 3',8-cyclase MoaA [Actinobacteria bacterium]|nr:GTP 3',8-cyclase MoaA [Actinomycetota bacterium]